MGVEVVMSILISFPNPATSPGEPVHGETVVAHAPTEVRTETPAPPLDLDAFQSREKADRPSRLARIWENKWMHRLAGGAVGTAMLAVPVAAMDGVLSGGHGVVNQEDRGSSLLWDEERIQDIADQGIPAREARGYENAGVHDLDWMEDLRAAQISPAELSAYLDAGVNDIDDMLDLAAHGISGSQVKPYLQANTHDLDRVKYLVSIGISAKAESLYRTTLDSGDMGEDWDELLGAYNGRNISGPDVSQYAEADVDRLRAVNNLMKHGVSAERLVAVGITPAFFHHFEKPEDIAHFESVEALPKEGISLDTFKSYLFHSYRLPNEEVKFYVGRGISGDTVNAYKSKGVFGPERIAALVADNISPETFASYNKWNIVAEPAEVKLLLEHNISAETFWEYRVEARVGDVQAIVLLASNGLGPDDLRT